MSCFFQCAFRQCLHTRAFSKNYLTIIFRPQETKNVELKLNGEKLEREGRVWFKKATELEKMKKKVRRG